MFDTFRREAEPNERKMVHCSDCKRQTIHSLEARCFGAWDDRSAQVSGGAAYSIYRCGACDFVSFETKSWDSEDVDYDEDGNVYHPDNTKQYPAPVSAHFDFNTASTPHVLDDILDEMLYALAGSKNRLATIGLRMAIEFIVDDKECAGTTLVQKINDLRKQDLIDDDQKDLLHRIRKKGNDGAHQAKGMNTAEIVAAMSIIEGLLERLYNGPARYEATMKKAKQLLKDEIADVKDNPDFSVFFK